MLSRYSNKRLRLTTEDGEVFTGVGEAYPSGYGLHVFDRAEESLLIGGVHIFQSDIRKIEILSDAEALPAAPGQYDQLMGDLLEGPYWIMDVLPEQVPADAGGQYFAVERYYLQPERLRVLRRKYAEILLRLNCYYDMAVSFDSCESWEIDPDPESFAEKVSALTGNAFLRAVFASRGTMIDYEPCDTYMTVYDPKGAFLDILQKLTAAEGLFLWQPPEE